MQKTLITTVPRLMLSVDVVAVCTSDLLRKELELEDAQVILGHVNNDAIRFHVFV